MTSNANWLSDLTGQPKSLIGMVHLPALPGTPLYDAAGGMKVIREWVRRDLDALQNGGIHAVMFCNENDRPYRLDADPASIAAMGDVIGGIRDEVAVPFGVNILWDPIATIALAAATGASFCREIFTGAFAGDFGVWVRSAGDAFRYRKQLDAGHVRLMFNINAEFAQQLAPRPIGEVAKSVVFSSNPDAILISGLITSQSASTSSLAEVKEAIGASGVPILANTGFKAANAKEILQYADGAVVGSSLKVDGITWNPVEEARVKELVRVVAELSR